MEDIVKAQNTYAIKVGHIGWYLGTAVFKDTFFKAMYQVSQKNETKNFATIFEMFAAGKVAHDDLLTFKAELLQVEDLMSNYKSIDVSTQINDNYEAHWKGVHEVTSLANSFITRMGDNVFDEILSAIHYALKTGEDLLLVDIQSGFLAGIDQSPPSSEKIDSMVAVIEKGAKYPNHIVMRQEDERFVLPKFNEVYTSVDLLSLDGKVLLRRYFDHTGMVHMQVEFD